MIFGKCVCVHDVDDSGGTDGCYGRNRGTSMTALRRFLVVSLCLWWSENATVLNAFVLPSPSIISHQENYMLRPTSMPQSLSQSQTYGLHLYENSYSLRTLSRSTSRSQLTRRFAFDPMGNGSGMGNFNFDQTPDESTLRRAYDAWRDFYSSATTNSNNVYSVSPHFDAQRYQNFKENYVALQRANIKAAQKATANGQFPIPPPMQLNEYGDCSAAEYQSLLEQRGAALAKNKNSNNDNDNNNVIPTTARSTTSASTSGNPLTPPPTATPWAGAATTTTASSSTNDNNKSQMDASSAYQTNSDGTYSYVPPKRGVNVDNTKRNPAPSSTSTVTPTPSPTQSSSYSSYVASTTAEANTMNSRNNVGAGPGGGFSYSAGNSGNYNNNNMNGPSGMGGMPPPQSQSYTSSYYPGPATQNNGYGENPYAPNGMNGNSGYPMNDGSPPPNNYNAQMGYGQMPSPVSQQQQQGQQQPVEPQLSADEQAALERARNRHSMIPKGVFDEDESEDENQDNSWADFGMPKQKKIRREKVMDDLPPPVINGVGNGGSIGIGAGTPNYSNNNLNGMMGSSTSFRPSDPNMVGNSYSNIQKVGQQPNNSYTQNRIRIAYQDWCNNHGKPFEEFRLPIFQENYLAMEQHSQETGTPLKQLNRYADLTPDEFNAVQTVPSTGEANKGGSSMQSTTPNWSEQDLRNKVESKDEFMNSGPQYTNSNIGEYSNSRQGEAPVSPLNGDGATEDLRLRMAYKEWCDRNGKQVQETRLAAFVSNFLAMEQYCMSQNIPIKPLNEYADLSPPEYQAILMEKQAKGDPIPSFNSASTSMPPPPGYGRNTGGNANYPQQEQQQQQAAQFSYGGQGYGSAMAPGGSASPPQQQQQIPFNGLVSEDESGQGGTIPPINIANGASAPVNSSFQRQSRQAPPRRPSEAEFKANAEARLKAFTTDKNKKKGEGEARLKRFYELKQQVHVVVKQKNVTLQEATRIVFSNATGISKAKQANDVESDIDYALVNGSNKTVSVSKKSDADIDADIRADEEKEVESNDKNKSNEVRDVGEESTTTFETGGDGALENLVQKNLTKSEGVSKNITSTIADVDANLTSANTTVSNITNELSPKAVSTQDLKSSDFGDDDVAESKRPVVDLSAVLKIEKSAIKKKTISESVNVTQADKNFTLKELADTERRDVEKKDGSSRSHYHKPSSTPSSSPSLNKTIKEDNDAAIDSLSKEIKEPEKRINASKSESKSVKKKNHPRDEIDVIEEKNDFKTIESEGNTKAQKITGEVSKANKRTAKRIAKRVDYDDEYKKEKKKKKTSEEDKLKAEMEAIQKKLKSFEEARQKAEKEAKEKAEEAKKLKAVMQKKAKAAQESFRKADAQRKEQRKES